MATDIFIDIRGFNVAGHFYPRELALISGTNKPLRARFRQPMPFTALVPSYQRRISDCSHNDHGHFWTHTDGWASEEIAFVLRRIIPHNARIITRSTILKDYFKDIGPPANYLCLDNTTCPSFFRLQRDMGAAHCNNHDHNNSLFCAVQNAVNLQRWFSKNVIISSSFFLNTSIVYYIVFLFLSVHRRHLLYHFNSTTDSTTNTEQLRQQHGQ